MTMAHRSHEDAALDNAEVGATQLLRERYIHPRRLKKYSIDPALTTITTHTAG